MTNHSIRPLRVAFSAIAPNFAAQALRQINTLLRDDTNDGQDRPKES
jgi:hypothetical protein